MKKRFALMLILAIIVYVGIFLFSIDTYTKNKDDSLINDVGRLYPAYVNKIVKDKQAGQLVQTINDARENGLKVSIAGSQHSQGGHTYYDDAVVLYMKDFDEVLNLDVKNQIITVQSGATWDDIQEYINPYNLSVKVMQSSNIFTVGGTLSANAHGRDLDKTATIETIKGFRLLLANGTILNVSRSQNSELFYLVIGGYGLFGVILDVDIELTDNEVYETKTKIVDYQDFPRHFQENIKNSKVIGLMLVRPSIDPNNLFQELAVLTWEKTNMSADNLLELKEEEHVARDKFFFGLSRKYDWGKKLRWHMQKKYESKENQLISRNNAMRPPTAPIAFLEYNSASDTDILQEYFIPTRNFINFSDKLRKILIEDDVNVISFTIRYVTSNNESYLSYAPNEEAFAIIYYSNVKLNEKSLKETALTVQKLVNLTLENDGTYYLTYNLFPTQEQIRRAYPQIDYFFERKKHYDPNELFMNKFYEKYALGVEDEEYWKT